MILKPILDLVFLIVISVYLAWFFPYLAVALLLLNVLFATQYWKTQLLLGSNPSVVTTSRRVKSAILAVVFTSACGCVMIEDSPSLQNEGFYNLWNHDYFPVLMVICVFAALLMATLVTEKRKR
jgi:hypothetical protein